MAGILEYRGSDAVLPVSRQTPLPVAPSRLRVTTSIMRPNDTATYAALDAIAGTTAAAAPMVFAGAAGSTGGGGVVTTALLQVTDVTKVWSLRLHLYSATPSVVSGDNAAFVLAAADQASYLGYIDLPPAAPEGSGSDMQVAHALTHLEYECAAQALYGRLETLLAVTTPPAQAVFRVTLACAERY